MDKNIGKKFDGRYEVTELIGVGGMADVYKGVDIIDNKPLAIKILKKEFAENEEFLRRFRNESKAIAVLSHPNIVKIYDVGFSEKIQYIVMEYIDGITLKEYIEEEKVLSWKDTVHFVIQILRALQHAHDKGIVHRDIKPQNIMMFTDGTIKVMDFGIAKFAREEGKTATDQAIGSVHYISPEQAKGDVTDAKSDIYSVGAMMYEMLTGKKPFDSDNPVAIAVMHMQDTAERPKAINPDIPAGLEEIVLKAIEKNPEDRYVSTTEMIADIEAFKANPEISFGYYQEEDDEQEETDNTRFFGAVAQDNDEPQTDEDGYDNTNDISDSIYNNGYNSAPVMNQNDYNYDNDDDEEEEQRPSLVVPVLTAAVVVVIIVAVVFVASLLSSMLKDEKKKGDYKMPDLIGMNFNDAVSKWSGSFQLKEDGFVYSSEYEAGCIIEQGIEPGSAFNKGDIVKVKLSKGMETVVIPSNLKNMNAELAQMELKELDLEVERKSSSSTDVEKGNVIKTEPEGGTEVSKGSTVILYVSMGIDAAQVKVEDYVGKKVDEAKALAEWSGLVPEIENHPSYEEEGVVFKQSIDKGTEVEKGTTIVFMVSNGLKPDGEISFTVPFPTDAYGRFIIDFIINNEDGTTATTSTSTLLAPEMSGGTAVIKGSGEKVKVTAVLTNLDNRARSNIGTYYFDFANKVVTPITENIHQAFVDVGGFKVETTTTAPPTEPPTVPTTTAPPPPPTEPPTQQTEPPTEQSTEAWQNLWGDPSQNNWW